MDNLRQFWELIETQPEVVIIPHSKPDADALGSSLAFAAFLQKMGLKTQVISPTDYPRFLNWMPGQKDIIHHREDNRERVAQLIKNAGLICCLDYSQLSRIDELEKPVRASKSPKMLIDHHIGKEDFADFEVYDTSAAATCELVFEFIQRLGKMDLLNKSMGECLYAGIMTDTGSFKHSNVTAKVHRITASLLDLGVNAAQIHHQVYDCNSEERIKFLGFALNEKLTILHEYKAAYFAISEEDLNAFNSQTGDTEGVVNYALSIEGISLAAMFTERDGDVRMSFRSFGSFSVADLAKNHFNGGGHKNAAGGKIANAKVEEVVEKFLSVLPEYRTQLQAGE